MSITALELRLSSSKSVAPDANVVFDEQTLSMTGVDYNSTTGEIKFNITGQYSIKWWVATETTLKGSIGFELQPSQGRFTSGCSPIKTGQVTGFGIIDVETVGTTLSLANKTATDTMLAKKTATKAYLLVTPIGSPSIRVYRGNLSASGSSIEVPLAGGLIFGLENLDTSNLRLVLSPLNGNTRYDYRRFCSFDGLAAIEGNFSDNAALTGAVIVDPQIYSGSREMYWAMIRVQGPVSGLWSTYEVRLFASGGLSRVTVWVNVVEEEVTY